MSIHVLSKLRPVWADAEQISGQWRHIESGRVYTVIGAGKTMVLYIWYDSVFYRSETGELYAQKLELFSTKFEPVTL